MKIYEELKTIFNELDIPVETSMFSKKALSTYVVLTPISDDFEFSDDYPQYDIHDVRISLITQKNYINISRVIVNKLVLNDFYITDRTFIDRDDRGFNLFNIDVQKFELYENNEEE